MTGSKDDMVLCSGVVLCVSMVVEVGVEIEVACSEPMCGLGAHWISRVCDS